MYFFDPFQTPEQIVFIFTTSDTSTIEEKIWLYSKFDNDMT